MSENKSEGRQEARLEPLVGQRKHPALAGVRDDGTVEGWRVETHYAPCEGIVTDHEMQCLRVIADTGMVNTETRVLFATLIADGWTPPDAPLPPDALIPSVEQMREILTPNLR